MCISTTYSFLTRQRRQHYVTSPVGSVALEYGMVASLVAVALLFVIGATSNSMIEPLLRVGGAFDGQSNDPAGNGQLSSTTTSRTDSVSSSSSSRQSSRSFDQGTSTSEALEEEEDGGSDQNESENSTASTESSAETESSAQDSRSQAHGLTSSTRSSLRGYQNLSTEHLSGASTTSGSSSYDDEDGCIMGGYIDGGGKRVWCEDGSRGHTPWTLE